MRICWLKTELLHPIDKGGKIRTYQMLKELKKEHHITYLTLDDGTAAPDALALASEYAHETVTIPHRTSEKFSMQFYFELANNLASPLPYFMQKYRSPAMQAEIERRVRGGEFDLVVCDFLNPAVNMPRDLGVPTLLFQHNVEAMIWRRHYEVQANPVKKAFLKNQWQKAVAYEQAACRRFDFVVAVSREDAEIFAREYGLTNVDDVPTGVDTEYFTPDRTVEKDAFNLVFTGSMDWLPNEDGIRWFTEEVYPLVKRSVPQANLTVVGRNPFPSLVELSRRDPSITITGRVPDVRPYMDRAAVSIVPLRIGGGTRLKIYEAMAMELPMVSTTIGAEGLPVTDGEHILLRDTAADFAAGLGELLLDRARAAQIGRQAADKVRREFGWAQVTRKFAELCERTAARKDVARNGRLAQTAVS